MGATDPPEIGQWWPPFQRAQECWQVGDLEQSRRLLELGSKEFPDAPHMKLAVAHQHILEQLNQGKPIDEALVRTLVREAVELAPDNAHVLVNAAVTMLDLDDHHAAGKYIVAVQNLQQQLEPRSEAVALYAIGRITRHFNKIDEAESLFRGAIGLDDSDPAFFSELANLLIESGRVRDARHVLAGGLRRHPGNFTLERLRLGCGLLL